MGLLSPLRRTPQPGPTEHIFVSPRPGDTIISLAPLFYEGWNTSHAQALLPQLQNKNTHNVLAPGLLTDRPVYLGSTQGAMLGPRAARDVSAFLHSEFLGLEYNTILGLSANFAVGATEGTAEALAGVKSSLESIRASYLEMRAGRVTRNTHYRFRKEELKAAANRVTPGLRRALGGDLATVARVSNVEGRVATRLLTTGGYEAVKDLSVMATQMAEVSKYARGMKALAKAGGVLGTIAVDGALGCLEVYTTDDPEGQSMAAASMIGGVVGGSVGLALGLIAGPPGWIGLALVAGGLSAVGGFAGSEVSGSLYATFGHGARIVDYTPLALCKATAHDR